MLHNFWQISHYDRLTYSCAMYSDPRFGSDSCTIVVVHGREIITGTEVGAAGGGYYVKHGVCTVRN